MFVMTALSSVLLGAVNARSAEQNAGILTKPLHIIVNGYCVSGYLELFGGWNGEVVSEIAKRLGDTQALNTVKISIGHADGIDESCRTLWILGICAARTGKPITLLL